MRSSPTWFILAGIMLLLDWYVFQVIKTVSQPASARTRTIIFAAYWILSVLSLVTLFMLPLFEQVPRSVRSIFFAIVIGFFLCKLVASVFFLIDDLRRGIQWLAGKLFFRNTEVEEVQDSSHISRSVFLSWLGLGVGGGLYATFIGGFSNKYNYKVKPVKLAYNNLPAPFKGLKIAQISDVHSGSFTDKAAVAKGVEKLMSLNPDLILFTGDLVNDRAVEMEEYKDVFSQLKAPMGVYSVLGNHDYGDYYYGKRPAGSLAAAKKANLDRLVQLQGEMGWKLLMDEHVLIEKEGAQIALLGIQNWSALSRFPKYGNLSKAYNGTESIPFKILLSHDPTHWDAQVRPEFPDIDLTLSGHTHGMQFGLEIPWFRWSPVQYVYKQWMGLYEEGTQKLYVNRGYGFIGYPGRVGILPEITLIELA